MGIVNLPVWDFVLNLKCKLFCDLPVLLLSEMSAPINSVRVPAVEPGRLLSVKPEAQVGPGHHHDPKPQRSYTEELHRDAITDRSVHNDY